MDVDKYMCVVILDAVFDAAISHDERFNSNYSLTMAFYDETPLNPLCLCIVSGFILPHNCREISRNLPSHFKWHCQINANVFMIIDIWGILANVMSNFAFSIVFADGLPSLCTKPSAATMMIKWYYNIIMCTTVPNLYIKRKHVALPSHP